MEPQCHHREHSDTCALPMRRQWGAATYTKCNVPLGSLGVQPVDGTYPTGAPTSLLSPMPHITFGGTGSGTML
jgi:hypothetical protein